MRHLALALALAAPATSLAKKPVYTATDVCTRIIHKYSEEYEDSLDREQMEVAMKSCLPFFADVEPKVSKKLFPCILIESTSTAGMEQCGGGVTDALNSFDPMPNRKLAACKNIIAVVAKEYGLPVTDEGIPRCMNDMHLQQQLLMAYEMNSATTCATKASSFSANERCWKR